MVRGEQAGLAFSYIIGIGIWIGLFFFLAWVFQQLYNRSLPRMNATFNKIDYWTSVNFYGLMVIFGLFATRVYMIQPTG